MKKYLLIIILSLFRLSGYSQNLTTTTEIDTLENFDNKTLVNYKIYYKMDLKEETQAFLYFTTIEVSRFQVFSNLFKKEITADSIVIHGLRTIYLDNGNYKIENYKEGELISMSYFDQSGKEICEQEFNQNKHEIGPCGIVNGQYLIHGQKEKNN
jgi:hypothetical protein